MDDYVIKTRCMLLQSLVKAWIDLQKNVDLKDKNIEGSFAHLLFSKKHIIPPSILSKIVDE